MNNTDNTASVNTILIVAVLVAVVGGLIWYMTAVQTPSIPTESNGRDINVDVDLPATGVPGGAAEPTTPPAATGQ